MKQKNFFKHDNCPISSLSVFARRFVTTCVQQQLSMDLSVSNEICGGFFRKQPTKTEWIPLLQETVRSALKELDREAEAENWIDILMQSAANPCGTKLPNQGRGGLTYWVVQAPPPPRPRDDAKLATGAPLKATVNVTPRPRVITEVAKVAVPSGRMEAVGSAPLLMTSERPPVQPSVEISNCKPELMAASDSVSTEPCLSAAKPSRATMPKRRKSGNGSPFFNRYSQYPSVVALAAAVCQQTDQWGGLDEVVQLLESGRKRRRNRQHLPTAVRHLVVDLLSDHYAGYGREASFRNWVKRLTLEFPPDDQTPDYLYISPAKPKKRARLRLATAG